MTGRGAQVSGRLQETERAVGVPGGGQLGPRERDEPVDHPELLDELGIVVEPTPSLLGVTGVLAPESGGAEPGGPDEVGGGPVGVERQRRLVDSRRGLAPHRAGERQERQIPAAGMLRR